MSAPTCRRLRRSRLKSSSASTVALRAAIAAQAAPSGCAVAVVARASRTCWRSMRRARCRSDFDPLQELARSPAPGPARRTAAPRPPNRAPSTSRSGNARIKPQPPHPVQRQQTVNPIPIARPLRLQRRQTTTGVPGIFDLARRHVHHLPHVSFAAPMPQQQSQQLLAVQPIGLGPPGPPRHFDARGIHHQIPHPQPPSETDAAKIRRAPLRSSSAPARPRPAPAASSRVAITRSSAAPITRPDPRPLPSAIRRRAHRQ